MVLKYTKYSGTKHGAHEKVLELVGNNKKVLEIGCATGYLSSKMKEHGCSVVGIEIENEAAEVARKAGIEVIGGDIEDMEKLPMGKASFDVIVLADVLEHMKEPDITLKKLSGFLKPEGYIVVSLPNIGYWTMRLKHLFGKWDYTETGIMDSGHLRFFTLKTARKLLENSGFKVLKEDYTPWKPAIYFITKIWPSLLAYQFIFKAGKA